MILYFENITFLKETSLLLCFIKEHGRCCPEGNITAFFFPNSSYLTSLLAKTGF